MSPGLLHYHFRDKRDMLHTLVDHLAAGFVQRSRGEDLQTWIDGALGLEDADATAVRCWVGVLGEALRDPSLFARIQRLLGAEARSLEHRGDLDRPDAVALLSLTVGYLIMGAFRPDLTGGHAAEQATRLVRQ